MKKCLLLSILFAPLVSYAASFDCSKAKSKVEKAICSDSDLSHLDEDLANIYKEALKKHPIPDYVKARQKDWLSLNQYCDSKKFTECLKVNYKKRISGLQLSNSTQIYANSKKFSYSNGDMVIEITPEKGTFSMWGGFAIHNQASQAQGKTIYTGCEFEGVLKDKTMTSAIGDDGMQISFKLKNNQIEFDLATQEKICSGFASIPSNIKKVN